MAAGFQRFVSKPMRSEQLVELLREGRRRVPKRSA